MSPNDIEDYFVPNKRNSYAPHGLQKAAMIGMVFLIVLSFTITNVQSLLWISSKWMVSTVLPAVIVDLTNKERGTEAIGTLKRSTLLDEAATLKAQDMAKNQYFAHYSPTGVSPWFWFGKVSYNFVHAGENLAINFTDSKNIVDAWMNSPSHRENIMNGNYTEIGVGTAEGEYQGYHTVYVVQLFGTPAAAATVTKQPVPAVAGVATNATKPKASSTSSSSVLSESVGITEEVVVKPADPVAVAVQESTDTADIVATSATTSIIQNTTISDMSVTGGGIVTYSDFIATSAPGIPATTQSSEHTKQKPQTPFFLGIATSPHTVLEILYVVIGLFVLCSLLISIFIEMRHQHPWQIGYGFALLVLMFGLFYVQSLLVGGVIIA